MLNFELVGKKVKDLRNQSGLNQRQLAEYLNVDRSYVSKCEKGERQFSADILEKITNLFGCSMEFFTSESSGNLPIPFALRANGINVADLEAIAVMNRLALNLRFMSSLLKGE